MNKPLKTITKYSLLLACLCLSILTTSCSKREELEAPLRKVRVIEALNSSGVYTRNFSGTLHSSQETSLSFKVPGSIREVLVKVGDNVTKGQVLATLDPSTYSLEVQQAQANLAQTKAQLRNAKTSYARAKRLYENNNYSKNDLDDSRAAAESAAASLQAAQKSVELAQLNQSYTKLRSEDNCAIASVDTEVGENVSSGQQIFFVTCGNELEVKVDVPESIIKNIKKGMEAKIYFSALENKSFKGVINEVGVSSVLSSTTFPVTILLTQDQNTEELKSGLSAEVEFTLPSQNNTSDNPGFVLPPFAVSKDSGGNFVFVAEPINNKEATIKKKKVTVGKILSKGIEITMGLEEGEMVVTSGVSVIREGMKVKY